MILPNNKRIVWISVVFLVSILCLSCSTSPPVVVEADSELLRVGVSADAPPFIFKQNGEIVGLEAEMADELSNYLEKKRVFVELPWDGLIPALLENRIDIIMAGMSITPARQYEIGFSKPYFKSGLMILVKDLQKFPFINNLETVLAQSITWRIGMVKGTTGETFVRKHGSGAKAVKAYAHQEQALSALIGGRIDVFVHDAPMVLMMAAQHVAEGVKPLPLMLNEEYIAWGMRKNDSVLTESVNAFLDHSKKEGALQTVIKRWIPLAE